MLSALHKLYNLFLKPHKIANIIIHIIINEEKEAQKR